MEHLLSREEFKEQVFKRDHQKCIVCKELAVDAHHLLDRSLFEDGGYYISNGVSLCSSCHIKAEKSEYSVEFLRQLTHITNIILPPTFLVNVIYDKWGNVEDFNKKYPRSLHAHISLGTTSDDRFMPAGYVEQFAKRDLIATEKLDGQNLCFNSHGVFARSHATQTEHAWDKPMVNLWNSIKNDLGDLELFGESMYAIHSIEYKKLESYFYLFAVRQNGIWLSWEEVKMWAQLFDFPTVPELKFQIPLSKIAFIQDKKKENDQLRYWLDRNLGMLWEEYVETPGALDGFDPITGKACCEGLVIRHANAFKVNEGILPVMQNEFDSLFKLVREKHVKTNEHWTKNWKRAKLKWEYDLFMV